MFPLLLEHMQQGRFWSSVVPRIYCLVRRYPCLSWNWWTEACHRLSFARWAFLLPWLPWSRCQSGWFPLSCSPLKRLQGLWWSNIRWPRWRDQLLKFMHRGPCRCQQGSRIWEGLCWQPGACFPFSRCPWCRRSCKAVKVGAVGLICVKVLSGCYW